MIHYDNSRFSGLVPPGAPAPGPRHGCQNSRKDGGSCRSQRPEGLQQVRQSYHPSHDGVHTGGAGTSPVVLSVDSVRWFENRRWRPSVVRLPKARTIWTPDWIWRWSGSSPPLAPDGRITRHRLSNGDHPRAADSVRTRTRSALGRSRISSTGRRCLS